MGTQKSQLDAVPPPFLGSFVGRAGEMAEIGTLLATARLLTLTGAGGSGKTRLAAQLAAMLHDRYAHGVRWADLSVLADETLVPDVIAAACGIVEHSDQATTALLVAALRPQRCLLVLDNCEHLLLACASLIERLLAACPELHVLATSREPLSIPSEVIWHVAPLRVPVEESGEALEVLASYEALQLFIARAAAALPSFRLTTANASAVVRICRQVAGLPLGLELAAAQLRALSLADLATHLADAVGLLTRGSRTAPPRPASRACARRSTGATTCSRHGSRPFSAGWACLREASALWPLRRLPLRFTRRPARAMSWRAWSISRS
jgi:non-specific serine/threonine protein kinase